MNEAANKNAAVHLKGYQPINRSSRAPRSMNIQKIDFTNLPTHFKSMILNQSRYLVKNYEPCNVITRTETIYYVTNPKAKRLEKGDASFGKDAQKSLGAPITDTAALLYDGLRIPGPSSDTVNQSRNEAEDGKMQRKMADTERRKLKEVPKGLNANGYRYIQENLQKSSSRMVLVKSGVPYIRLCENRKEIALEVEDKSSQSKWDHLVIDQDREQFFGGVLSRFESKIVEANKKKDLNATDKCEVQPKINNFVDPIGGSTGDLKAKTILTTKEIEIELGIKRIDHHSTIGTAQRVLFFYNFSFSKLATSSTINKNDFLFYYLINYREWAISDKITQVGNQSIWTLRRYGLINARNLHLISI